jgi:hypothetical protein
MASGATAIMNPHDDEEALRSVMSGPAGSLLGGVAPAAPAPSAELSSAVSSAVGGGILGGVAGGSFGGGGEPQLAPTASVKPNVARQTSTSNFGGGFGDEGGGGFGGMQPYRPGHDNPNMNPRNNPLTGSPSGTNILPKDAGKGSPGWAGMPIATAPVAPPPPTPPPAPPATPTSAPSIKEVDEEQQHGFAANILAGGMFQSPPELSRNILLGN